MNTIAQHPRPHRFTTFLLVTAAAMILLAAGSAAAAEERFTVNQVLSDGKGGRVWRHWQQQLREQPVYQVEVVLSKVKGGNDTYVNLRFGTGPAFEGGRRALVPDGGPSTIAWNVDQAPNGRPLILNAYNGEVQVQSVVVRYEGGGRAAVPPRDSVPSFDRDSDGQARGSDDDDAGPQAVRPGVDARALERCRRMSRIRAPRIEVGDLDATGGLFSGKYKLAGSMSGICIEEAGYFENGRLKEAIEFPLSDTFQRQEFNVRVRTGRNGELRMYTTDGKEEVLLIDEEVAGREAGPAF